MRTRTDMAPNPRSSHQRKARAVRSGFSMHDSGRHSTIKGIAMGLKQIALGYAALGAYAGSTHAMGVDFFQLQQPDYRALWLLGAVLVLGIVTRADRAIRRGGYAVRYPRG